MLTPQSLLFLLFCYSCWHSRGTDRRPRDRVRVLSARRSFSSFPASRKRRTAATTVTDRPTDGSACGMARGKIPFIPVADCDLGVSRILFLVDLLDCSSAIRTLPFALLEGGRNCAALNLSAVRVTSSFDPIHFLSSWPVFQ